MRTRTMDRFRLADGTFPPLAGADDVGGEAAAPETPAAPAAAPVAPPQQAAPAAAPATNPGPWEKDLERYFPDEGSRAAADRFMREYVQPSRTQYEQETAPMRELYDDLLADPKGTIAAVAAELFGDEASDFHDAELAQALNGLFDGEQPPAEQEAAPQGEVDQLTLDKLPPEMRQMYEDWAAQQQKSEYDQVVDGWIDQSEHLSPEDKDALSPFISAAAQQGGDMAMAEQMYLDYQQNLLQRHGVQPPAPPQPGAPVVAGEATAAAGAPPADKQYKSWDDLDAAFDDYAAEQRAGGVPPVGTV